jgi:uncharacterized protein YgiM (DUF1202 family)
MGKISCRSTIVAVIMLISSLTGCHEPKLTIVAEETTKVFKEYPASGPPNSDHVITTLGKGESVDVIRERYSKDYMFYEVQLKDGRTGYLWVGDKFRVVPKNSSK